MELEQSPDLPAMVSYWANAAVLALLAFGLYSRHRRRIHVPVMLSCFSIDLANVVFIELRRSAVEKAISTATSSGEWVLKLHILVSTLTVVGYLVALFTGWRLLRRERGRRVHRANAVSFMVLRVLNFLTSFYV